MAPETGLEPVTRRLIPTCRDSTIEQLLAYPTGGFHAFDLPFAGQGQRSRGVFLTPDQFPRTILAGEFAAYDIGTVVGV